MFWETTIKENAQPLVAEEDIKTIAFLFADNPKMLPYSPYAEISYHTDEVSPKIDVVCDAYYDIFFINEGYFSVEYGNVTYKDNMYIIKYNNDNGEYKWEGIGTIIDNLPVKPYVCIIPKGTKYYVNEYYEIVSESIIVKEPFVCQWKTIENKQS